MATDGLHPTDTSGSLNLGQLAARMVKDAVGFYEDWHKALLEDLDFGLGLAHYDDDEPQTKDQQRIQPKGLELYHQIYHNACEIASSPVYIGVEPVDEIDDPLMADDAKWALESVIYNRTLRYRKLRELMVLGAHAARSWSMALDFLPQARPWGELYFRLVPPSNLMSAPGWNDMHDITCPYVIELQEPRKADLMRLRGQPGWDAEAIEELQGEPSARGDRSEGGDASVYAGQSRLARSGIVSSGTSETEVIKIAKIWLRFSDEIDDANPEPTDQFYDVPPDQHYMACTECGVDLPDEAAGLMRDENGMLPDYGPPCPNCGQPMERIGVLQEEQFYLKYPNGRLIVLALKDEKILYDGDWPVRCRTFPYMTYSTYEHPLDPYGQSDTSLGWSLQVILNGLLQFGYEQMQRNVDILVALKGGLENAAGDTFQFTDLHGQIAYAKDILAAKALQHFQGSGIPAGLLPLYQAFAGSFHQNKSGADIGLAQSDSRNIPVGTIQELARQVNIPIERHKRALHEEESLFFGCVLDYIIGTWTEERWVRYRGPLGQVAWRLLSGANIPNADIVVEAEPTLRGIDLRELEVIERWSQMEPPLQRLAGQMLGISPRHMAVYLQDRQNWMRMMGVGAGGPTGSRPTVSEDGRGAPPVSRNNGSRPPREPASVN